LTKEHETLQKLSLLIRKEKTTEHMFANWLVAFNAKTQIQHFTSSWAWSHLVFLDEPLPPPGKAACPSLEQLDSSCLKRTTDN
jgi:hypothetical protein